MNVVCATLLPSTAVVPGVWAMAYASASATVKAGMCPGLVTRSAGTPTGRRIRVDGGEAGGGLGTGGGTGAADADEVDEGGEQHCVRKTPPGSLKEGVPSQPP